MTTATPMDDPTLAYYENHAETFFGETVDVDMAPLYARFLVHVPPGGRILDAGCGSGRDALAFRRLGYGVTAFEASPALARLATEHCGLPVEVRRFQEVEWEDRFDGIWACASLLHVPPAELPEALRRLGRALKSDGMLYVSFKYGAGEREHGGRRFTDLGEAGLAALVGAVPALEVLETRVTVDRRPGRDGERWLNAIVGRVSPIRAAQRMSGQLNESSGPAEGAIRRFGLPPVEPPFQVPGLSMTDHSALAAIGRHSAESRRSDESPLWRDNARSGHLRPRAWARAYAVERPLELDAATAAYVAEADSRTLRQAVRWRFL